MPDESFTELAGDRVVLRRFRMGDLPEFVAYRSCAEVARFQSRGKHRITACCAAGNAVSAAVLEKLGMRREGHLRQSTWAKGEWTDDLLYGLLCEEWRPG